MYYCSQVYSASSNWKFTESEEICCNGIWTERRYVFYRWTGEFFCFKTSRSNRPSIGLSKTSVTLPFRVIWTLVLCYHFYFLTAASMCNVSMAIFKTAVGENLVVIVSWFCLAQLWDQHCLRKCACLLYNVHFRNYLSFK